jgi:hypothetical protein
MKQGQKRALEGVLARLAGPAKTRPNLTTPELAGWRQGERGFVRADGGTHDRAQNLITHLADHRPLREARVWLLFRRGVKADPDRRVELGRARKCSALVQALAARAGETPPDFCITLNQAAWADLGEVARLALLDHELSHCAATIAGRYVPPAAVADLVKALGTDHLETCTGERDKEGRVLVRYLRRVGEIKAGKPGYGKQPLAWRIRKHPLEDFPGVIGRWGPWTPELVRLVDILEEPDASLPLLEVGLAGGGGSGKKRGRR